MTTSLSGKMGASSVSSVQVYTVTLQGSLDGFSSYCKLCLQFINNYWKFLFISVPFTSYAFNSSYLECQGPNIDCVKCRVAANPWVNWRPYFRLIHSLCWFTVNDVEIEGSLLILNIITEISLHVHIICFVVLLLRVKWLQLTLPIFIYP